MCPDTRCWRCDQPKSRHIPGPPDPPHIKGHLGAVESKPGCCNAFQEPPADLRSAQERARMYRRQRDGYDREARRYRDALLAARAIIDRAVAEDNFA